MPAIGSARITPGTGALKFDNSIATGAATGINSPTGGPTGPTGPVGPAGAPGPAGQAGSNGSLSDVLAINNLGTISGTTLNLDVTSNRVNTLILANNITFSFSLIPPDVLQLISVMVAITQDSVGTRTITWASNIKWQGGFAPSLSTAPGATDILQALSLDDGATWLVALAYQVPAPS